jgi:hypothetical protein
MRRSPGIFSSRLAVDFDGHNLYIESTSIVKIPVEIWWNAAILCGRPPKYAHGPVWSQGINRNNAFKEVLATCGETCW